MISVQRAIHARLHAIHSAGSRQPTVYGFICNFRHADAHSYSTLNIFLV